MFYLEYITNSDKRLTEGDKTIIVTDTLFLAIGNFHSLFLDPYYKEKLEISRKARIARSKKIGRVNMEHDNIDDICAPYQYKQRLSGRK